MIQPETIEKLAALSRLDLTSTEKVKFAQDIGNILAYVDQIQKAPSLDVEPKAGPVRNVFREDANPIEEGVYTDKIVSAFPQKEGNALKVKKIL